MNPQASFEELYALGLPVAMLARQFGYAESSIYQRAHRKGIARKPRAEILLNRRNERVGRIRGNLELSPSVPMFAWGDE